MAQDLPQVPQDGGGPAHLHRCYGQVREEVISWHKIFDKIHKMEEGLLICTDVMPGQVREEDISWHKIFHKFRKMEAGLLFGTDRCYSQVSIVGHS